MKHLIQHTVLVLLTVLFAALPGLATAQNAGSRPAGEQQGPDTYVLSAAYPNPFNPSTRFTLTVRQRQSVRIDLYNMLGQPVRNLFSGVMEAGETRTITIDASDLPAGIYLYRVRGEGFSASRQVTLLK